jgi:hypothetical protein
MAHTLGMLTPARFAIDVIDPIREISLFWLKTGNLA